jgi:putative ABC transport system ATP-binding protein
MIRIQQLDFRYREGEFHLRIPELTIDAGSKIAVIGPSGTGKTTLLHLLVGIQKPSAGRITVDDVDVTALDEAACRDFRIRKLGLVFQEFELLPYLTVLDNILLPYRIHHVLRLDDAVRARARTLAAEVGIEDKLARHPRKLSQGERQRVAVCRALLTAPQLILADEPTGNLDPENTARVVDILLDQAARSGATLLIATHNHSLLDRFDRVVDLTELAAAADSASTGP